MQPELRDLRAVTETTSPRPSPRLVHLEGQVAEPPTLFTTREGRPGASFLLEVATRRGPGRPRRRPMWHPVVGWDRLVHLVQDLRAGQEVAILGRETTLRRRVWGRLRSVPEITLRSLRVLGSFR